MQAAFLIFLGGGLGSVARWLMADKVAAATTLAFPWGTLAVNALGCGLLGLLTGWLAVRGQLSEPWRLALATGVLGGFTTYSAFTLDAVALWERGQPWAAGGYTLLTLAAGFLALLAGLALGRLF
jgi:CrcB protein